MQPASQRGGRGEREPSERRSPRPYSIPLPFSILPGSQSLSLLSPSSAALLPFSTFSFFARSEKDDRTSIPLPRLLRSRPPLKPDSPPLHSQLPDIESLIAFLQRGERRRKRGEKIRDRRGREKGGGGGAAFLFFFGWMMPHFFSSSPLGSEGSGGRGKRVEKKRGEGRELSTHTESCALHTISNMDMKSFSPPLSFSKQKRCERRRSDRCPPELILYVNDSWRHRHLTHAGAYEFDSLFIPILTS